MNGNIRIRNIVISYNTSCEKGNAYLSLAVNNGNSVLEWQEQLRIDSFVNIPHGILRI